MATLTILGAGMMGTALCVPLLDRGHQVRLVGTHLDRGIIDSLRSTGFHPKLAMVVPPGAQYFQVEEFSAALQGADALMLGVSSEGVCWAGRTIAPHVWPGCPILSVTKGLGWDGRDLVVLPDVLLQEIEEPLRAQLHPAAIAGPCIAGELARRVECCVVFTGRDEQMLRYLADLAHTDYYHVRCSTDVVGNEVSAALKNGYALAVGIARGLHEKRGGIPGPVAMHNFEAAVFAQAVVEMEQWVQLAGGRPGAAWGLAGAGDLMVTCNAGRTGRFGYWLGLGLTLPEAVERMAGATLECIDIIRVAGAALPVLERSGRIRPSRFPLMRHLVQVIEQGEPVRIPFEDFFRDLAPSPAE